MGKSASGKDTIYAKLLKKIPTLKKVVLYTTRPIRDGEHHGLEYYFIDEEYIKNLQVHKKIIEERTYMTIYGPWKYLTVDDNQIDIKTKNQYLMIGTLESYEIIRNYFGKEMVIPIYIEVETGLRLSRAIDREKQQQNPKYKELCRRFLADEEDFKEENLDRLEITKKFINNNLEICLTEISKMIINYT